MKRILHVMHNLERSGMETMLLSSADEWARHGIQCGVLVTARSTGPLADEMKAAGYEVIHNPLRGARSHYSISLRSLQDFHRLCRVYDGVHIHLESGATLYALIAWMSGARIIVRSIHNTFLFDGMLRVRKWITRGICRAIGVRFGMVSDSVAECERQRFGNHGPRTWNWIDVNYFRPPSATEREEAQAKLGIVPGEAFHLISVGNCNPAKNHQALLRALVPVAQQGPLLYFHVGREGAARTELNLARQLGLQDVARFEGSRDPRRYYWGCDAFVMPSLYEGLGVSALEAIACGCPAALSDVSGLCEILSHARHSVAIGTTPEAITPGLLQLAATPAAERRAAALDDSASIRELFSPRRGVAIMASALYGLQAESAEGVAPMQIAMCAPADVQQLCRFSKQPLDGVPPGLGSTATTPLIIELLKRGHEVTLFTLSNELPAPVDYHWGRLHIFVRHSRTYGSARNFFMPEILALRRLIQQRQPAFVHAHWTYEFALAALASGVPTLVTIHDLPWRVLSNFRDRYRTVRLMMAYAVSSQCWRYTAVSEDAAQHFRRYMRPGARIETIPNFVQAEILALGETREPKMTGPLACAIVLQGWSRRKNGSAALEAFASVRRARPETTLLAFGRDFQPDGPAHRWARERGFEQGVHFVGLVPYEDLLIKLRDEVDILIHPSLDEAFSMTIVEAMSLQLPVIAGEGTPGVREALADGRVGLIVDVREPAAIAAATLRLIDDPLLRTDLGRLARARVLQRYTVEAVLPQYERLYCKLAGAAVPRAISEQEIQA